jgi:hypothetical protein
LVAAEEEVLGAAFWAAAAAGFVAEGLEALEDLAALAGRDVLVERGGALAEALSEEEAEGRFARAGDSEGLRSGGVFFDEAAPPTADSLGPPAFPALVADERPRGGDSFAPAPPAVAWTCASPLSLSFSTFPTPPASSAARSFPISVSASISFSLMYAQNSSKSTMPPLLSSMASNASSAEA